MDHAHSSQAKGELNVCFRLSGLSHQRDALRENCKHRKRKPLPRGVSAYLHQANFGVAPAKQGPYRLAPSTRAVPDSLHKKPARTLGESAQSLLHHYSFPGNVRELANLIERAVLFCNSATVEAAHFPPDLKNGCSTPASSYSGPPGELPRTEDPQRIALSFRPGERSLADLEDQIIQEVLEHAGGNKSLAAKYLGITRWKLDRRRKK